MFTQLCLFWRKFKLIAIDLSIQQALHTDPKATEQINFTGNLNWDEDLNDNTTIVFIVEEGKETISGFSQEIVRVF